MITVAEFRTLEKIQELRLMWTDLWLRTRNASFFQSFDWFIASLDQLRPGQSPNLFVVSIAGKPVGILPWFRQTTSSGIGAIRRLTDGDDCWAVFSSPVGPNPTATLAAVMRYLKNSARDWDVIDLKQVDVDGTDRGRTRNAMRTVGLRPRTTPGAHTAGVKMNDDWSDYWTSRPGELQSGYSRAEHRLSVFGDVRYARFRPQTGSSNPRWDLFTSFLRADRDSMFPDSHSRRKSLTKAQQALLSNVHEAAARSGCVDVNVLYVNNRPTASAYNFVSGGRVECVRFGIAADATNDAATVLMGLMLRDGFERGDEFFRFPPGDPMPTSGWANHFETSYRLSHYRTLGLRSQIARFGDWLDDDATTTSRQPTTIHVPVPVKRPVVADTVPNRELTIVG